VTDVVHLITSLGPSDDVDGVIVPAELGIALGPLPHHLWHIPHPHFSEAPE